MKCWWTFEALKLPVESQEGQSRPFEIDDRGERTTMASRKYIKTAITAMLGLVLFLLSGGAIFAQDAGNYPNRPVMMIVPFAPGGASDFVARIIQQGVSEILGQQIVVDNRPGAAGMIGTEFAARAAPDGYTAFLGNVGTVSINPGVFAANMRIKPDKDLSPGHDLRRNAKHPDHPAGLPGQQRQRADRLCEGEPGQGRLCLARQQHPQPAGNGGIQEGRRARHGACALQGRRRPGGDGRSRRPCRPDVHHHVVRDGVRERRTRSRRSPSPRGSASPICRMCRPCTNSDGRTS